MGVCIVNYEFVAMFFGIIGAFTTARAAIQNDADKARIYWGVGGSAFIISNTLLFVVAAHLGLSAMAIQLVLLSAASSLQLYTRTSWVLSVISLIVIMASTAMFFSVFFEAFHIGFDIYPSIFAIIASFVWAIRDERAIIAGFILFITADILYLTVAISNHLPWFFLQTCAYLIFALVALNSMRKANSKIRS